MGLLPAPVEKLADEFARFPGIGPKTAQRMAFHAASRVPPAVLEVLASAIIGTASTVTACPDCFFLSEGGQPCAVCRQSTRQRELICVVEEPGDVLAIERTGEYRGLYHVLGAALSPLDGIGPNEIHCRELLTRAGGGEVLEVILATDSDLEGEATAGYLQRRLEGTGVRVSRLAHGLPVGGELAYADERTVARAFSGRQPL